MSVRNKYKNGNPGGPDAYRDWALEQVRNLKQLRSAQAQGIIVQRDGDLTLDNLLNPYGCNGLFDVCTDGNLISLSMCGADTLMDAIGWTASTMCREVVPYLTWVGEAQLAGTNPGENAYSPNGIVEECCEDRTPVNWGTCEYDIEGFAHLGNSGGALCIYDNLDECINAPSGKRLDGTPIASNSEFRAIMASEVILQNLKWMFIHGDKANAGHFDGLQQIITTGVVDRNGVPCPAMDSIVIDWNGGCYAEDGAGTWNDARGTTLIPQDTHIIDVIYATWKFTKKRIMMSPTFRRQQARITDRFLVATSEQIECLMDCLLCKRWCPEEGCNTSMIHTMEAQLYREGLMEGGANAYGAGFLQYRDMILPFLEVDYTGYDAAGVPDMYILHPRHGNLNLLYGEFQDTRSVVRDAAVNGFGPSGTEFVSTDGGRFLHYRQYDNTCFNDVMDYLPRVQYPGRWAQVRISGFECSLPNVTPTCLPWDAQFYIPGPLTPATS